jgi:putative transposase
LFNGELEGYRMSQPMTKDIGMRALFRATSTKRPAKGLALHSDRVSQYCAHDYQKMLKQFGMISSMSRKADCWDNAPMASFWGTLKNGLVNHRRYHTRGQAMVEITEYIKIFYNRQCKQARLGYLSLAAFTQRYYANKIAA